jgi:DNA-binding transcriptional ArsR family regulator
MPSARIRSDLDDLSAGWRRHRWAAGLAVLENATRRFYGAVLTGLSGQLALRRKLDVARRMATPAAGGTAAVVNGLHRSIRLRGIVLEVDRPWDFDVRLAGQGVVHVPSPFLVDEVLKGVTDAATGPVLVHYPARVLLGATRSRVLYAFLLGGGTSDLARRVGISPASASEHAAALRDAGLVTTAREGRRVDQRLTDLGVQLLS